MDCKLSGAGLLVHPCTWGHAWHIADAQYVCCISTCVDRPPELPAPGTVSVCFQSWQGPWRPPPVRPTILTPCPIWYQGLSALLLSSLPLHGGNFQVFSVMHRAASPRHLPRSECQQGAHSFYLSRCISCCNRVLQTWWLKPQTFSLKATSPKPRCWQGRALRACREETSCLFQLLAAAGSPRCSLAYRRVTPISACFTRCSFSVSLCPNFPLKRTLVVGLGPTLL